MNARCGLRAIESEHPTDVITFEYHYGDDFENEFTVGRTEWYHVISHPYAYFDGINPVIGASNCLVATETYRTRYNDRMDETWGVSPIDIAGQWADIGAEYVVMANYTRVDDVALDDLQATLLLYEDNIEYCCGPGGNHTWNGVVRVLYDEPITLSTVGAPVRVSTTFAIDPTWNRSNLHLVAYVQNSVTREIYQARRVTAPATAVDPPTLLVTEPVLSISPNPMRGAMSITVDFSGATETGPVRLDVLDVAGRQVDRLAARIDPAGRNVIAYDGTPLTPGVYFVRLASARGTRVERMVRIR